MVTVETVTVTVTVEMVAMTVNMTVNLTVRVDLIHRSGLHADEGWIRLRLEQVALHVLIQLRPGHEGVEA